MGGRGFTGRAIALLDYFDRHIIGKAPFREDLPSIDDLLSHVPEGAGVAGLIAALSKSLDAAKSQINRRAAVRSRRDSDNRRSVSTAVTAAIPIARTLVARVASVAASVAVTAPPASASASDEKADGEHSHDHTEERPPRSKRGNRQDRDKDDRDRMGSFVAPGRHADRLRFAIWRRHERRTKGAPRKYGGPGVGGVGVGA